MDTNKVIAVDAESKPWQERLNEPTGKVLFRKDLYTDPDTGMEVRLVRYPKGFVNPLHTHHCAHGMYVLEGTLQTHEGNTARAISYGFPKAIAWSMAPPRKRTSPSCSSPTSLSIFTISKAETHKAQSPEASGDASGKSGMFVQSRHSHVETRASRRSKMNSHSRTWRRLGATAAIVLGTSCGGPGKPPVLEGKQIQIEWNELLHTRVSAVADGAAKPLGPFAASETVTTGSGMIADFQLTASQTDPVQDKFGAGRRVRVIGLAGTLRKTVEATVYDEFPSVAVFEVEYANQGDSDVEIQSWTNHGFTIEAQADSEEPVFWSYQSGSYEKRPDWVLPLKQGFSQDNFLGMNASDYGGGTPVSDVWSRQAGLAVGHLELVPKLVSLPVAMPERQPGHRRRALRREANPEAGRDDCRRFAHLSQRTSGDYFAALQGYRRLMVKQGIHLAESPADAFEPIWCAWGYRRDVTPQQIYGTLPIVKKLGFRWVGVDDGWQTAEGDWYLNPKKFPHGDADMQRHRRSHSRRRFPRPIVVGAAGGRPRHGSDQAAPRLPAAQQRRLAPGHQLVEFLLSLPGLQAGAGERQGAGHENDPRLGLRRPQARRPASERRAALLQPGSPSRPARGVQRGGAGVLQDDLRHREELQAGRAGGVLPLRYGLFVLHAAVPEHGRGVRSGKLLADPHQRRRPSRR